MTWKSLCRWMFIAALAMGAAWFTFRQYSRYFLVVSAPGDGTGAITGGLSPAEELPQGASPVLMSTPKYGLLDPRGLDPAPESEAQGPRTPLGAEDTATRLRRALCDADPAARRRALYAVRALFAQAHPEARALGESALRDSEPDIRAEAARLLAVAGQGDSAPALRALADDDEALVRRETAIALGRLRDAEAMPEFETLLRDPDNEVRLAAVHGVAMLGPSRAIGPLNAALYDADLEVAFEAAQLLRAMERSQDIAPVVQRLRVELSHPDVDRVLRALERLRVLDAREALPEARALTSHGDRRIAAVAEDLRRQWQP